MADLERDITHWALGVVTSAEPDDEMLQHALVRADNVQLVSVAGSKAQPSNRGGIEFCNSTPFSNTSATAGPAIVGGRVYPFVAAGATTNYIVMVQTNGDVHLLLDDGVTQTLAAAFSFVTALTAGTVLPDIAVMNNRAFLQDGLGGRTSLKGSTKVDWGVNPVTGLALAPTGVGVMSGDYEVIVTGWNDQISAESNRSAIVSITGLASQQLQITVDSVSGGFTWRYFRVYLRKASLGSGFFRVQAGTGYVGGTVDGFPLFSGAPTVTTTINVSDATLVAAVLIPPPVNAHGLPPAGSLFVTAFQRRLFVADQDNVYWSELDKPDAFNPLSTEPMRSRDPRGGSIVGMRVFDKQLHVLTDTARITLNGGADLRSWIWDTADEDSGAVSPRSIVVNDQLMAWWDLRKGPIMLLKGGARIDIGRELIREQTRSNVISTSRAWEIAAAADEERIVFAIPEVGKSRLTKLLAFHTTAKRWESTRWDPMDPGVVFTALDTDEKPTLYLGNYNGQLFRMNTGLTDGMREAKTLFGTIALSAGAQTVFTDGAAIFDVTGAGMIERKVTFLDSNGRPVTGDQRPRIASNTGTTFTLSESFTIPSAGNYTYIIGGPDVVMETFWDHMGAPFVRKRHDRMWIEFRSGASPAQLTINLAVNTDPTQAVFTSVLESDSALWDQAFWDVSFWDQISTSRYRKSLIKSGLNYRIQIRSPYPNQDFTLTKLWVQARVMSNRYTRGY